MIMVLATTTAGTIDPKYHLALTLTETICIYSIITIYNKLPAKIKEINSIQGLKNDLVNINDYETGAFGLTVLA